MAIAAMLIARHWASDTVTAEQIEISTSPSSKVVTFRGMAPGDSTASTITMSNNGDSQLRYAIASSATNDDGKGLRDQLQLIIRAVDPTADPPCHDLDGALLYSGKLGGSNGVLVGDTAAGSQSEGRTLDPGASKTLCFQVSLPPDTGNTYPGAVTTATFTFGAESDRE